MAASASGLLFPVRKQQFFRQFGGGLRPGPGDFGAELLQPLAVTDGSVAVVMCCVEWMLLPAAVTNSCTAVKIVAVVQQL